MVFPLSLLRQYAQDAISDLPALKDAAAKVAAHILHGAHGQKKAGGSETFWQFREYSHSDRPQDIDWRQSGKTEHIYVREKELQTPQSIYFWANRSASMDFRSDAAAYSKLECARILSLALAMLFRRGEERIGVLGQNRVGNSDDALDRIGRALLEDNNASLPAGKIPSNSTLVLCSDYLETLDEIEAALAPFAGQNARGIVIQILDPAELELSYDGHRIFENAGSARHKIDNVASIREAYQDKIAAHIQAVEDLCASYGFSYVLHVSDRPLEDTLTRVWEGEQR